MLKIKFADAQCALHRYNRREVVEIDRRAAFAFRNGLGCNEVELFNQLNFICNHYGGLPRTPAVGFLEEVADTILVNRDRWCELLDGAPRFGLASAVKDRTNTLSQTTAFPFAIPQPLHFAAFAAFCEFGGAAQTRCLTKFLHLLNPHAFVIQDRWIGQALGLDVPNNGSGAAYANFMTTFEQFVAHNRELLLNLRAYDSPHSWSEIKLVDKVLLCRNAAALKFELAS